MRSQLVKIVLAVTVVSSCGACGTPKATAGDDFYVQGATVAIDRSARIYYSEASGFSGPVRVVIRNDRDWTSRWQLIARAHEPAPPQPVISFDKSMLLIVSGGRFLTYGDSVYIDSLLVKGDTLTALVRIYRQCSPFPIMPKPVEVIRLPVWRGAVHFEDREYGIEGCG